MISIIENNNKVKIIDPLILQIHHIICSNTTLKYQFFQIFFLCISYIAFFMFHCSLNRRKKKKFTNSTCFFENKQFIDRQIFKQISQHCPSQIKKDRCPTPNIYSRKNHQNQAKARQSTFKHHYFFKSQPSVHNTYVPFKNIKNDDVAQIRKSQEQFVALGKRRPQTMYQGLSTRKQKKENIFEWKRNSNYVGLKIRKKNPQKSNKCDNIPITPWLSTFSNDTLTSQLMFCLK